MHTNDLRGLCMDGGFSVKGGEGGGRVTNSRAGVSKGGMRRRNGGSDGWGRIFSWKVMRARWRLFYINGVLVPLIGQPKKLNNNNKNN